MVRDDEHALAVAELFTAAALSGDWSAPINAAADACGAGRGQLIGVASDTSIPFNWMPRADPMAVEEFVAVGAGDPLKNPRLRVGLTAPLMQARHDLPPSTEDELRRYSTYADYCRRWGAQFGSQIALVRNERMSVGFAVLRDERRGAPPPEDQLAFATLALHVHSAVNMQIALGGQGAQLVAGAFEAVRAAAFLCDGFGLIRALTPAAEIALQRGLLRMKAGNLSAAHPADGRALEDAVRQAVGGIVNPYAPARTTLVVRDVDAPEKFEVVEVAPLPRKVFGLGFEPRAVVTVRGRPGDDAELCQVLQIAFALTAAEAAVLTRLIAGEARESIADERQVSVNTVRMQIKRAFAKMSVHCEAELFALIRRMH
jgi:DNA-binding CsgD family transcriptional regulator